MSEIQSRVVILLAVVAVTVGCSLLSRDHEVPEPTYAFQPAPEGSLAVLSRTCVDRVEDGESCFLLLDRNDESLRWRLALIDSAQISLDLQTYLLARDFSGQLLIRRMLKAAERGVRVRLLVDDFLMRGKDRAIAALDQHPNIEIKLWNPGRHRQLGRNLDFLLRLRELNHRMHNKVLIADNRVVISGGRNTADAYFGLSDSYNFFDLDLLAVGPVVTPVSEMFDRYWNSPQAVPGLNFHRRASADEIPAIKADSRRFLEASQLSEIISIDPREWDDYIRPVNASVRYQTSQVTCCRQLACEHNNS